MRPLPYAQAPAKKYYIGVEHWIVPNRFVNDVVTTSDEKWLPMTSHPLYATSWPSESRTVVQRLVFQKYLRLRPLSGQCEVRDGIQLQQEAFWRRQFTWGWKRGSQKHALWQGVFDMALFRYRFLGTPPFPNFDEFSERTAFDYGYRISKKTDYVSSASDR